MHKWLALHALFGVSWCAAGIVSLLYIFVYSCMFLPSMSLTSERDDRDWNAWDTVGCFFAVILLWPMLLKYFRTESVGSFSKEKWLM